MTTFEDVQGLAPRESRWRAARDRVLNRVAKVYVAAHAHMPSRFDVVQLAGGATASVGVFELWGIGVGLFVTGLCVLGAGALFERQAR